MQGIMIWMNRVGGEPSGLCHHMIGIGDRAGTVLTVMYLHLMFAPNLRQSYHCLGQIRIDTPIRSSLQVFPSSLSLGLKGLSLVPAYEMCSF